MELWNNNTCKIEKTTVEIVKATEKSVTVLNRNTGEKCNRKPQKREGRCYDGGVTWAFFVDDGFRSGCYKAPATE